jgi:hypothetical protein
MEPPIDRAVAAFDAAFAGDPASGDRVLGLLKELVHQDQDRPLVDAA